MSDSKKKIAAAASVVLCVVFAAISVVALSSCADDTYASFVKNIDSAVPPSQGSGYVSGGSYVTKVKEDEVTGPYYEFDYYEMPETVDSEIVPTVYVENPDAVRTSEFDENGVATCIRYYRAGYSLRKDDDSTENACFQCLGECKGHEEYLTLGGGTYTFYPYSVSVAPISSTVETPEIQFTLIFKEKPQKSGKLFLQNVQYWELSSLTGDPIEASVSGWDWSRYTTIHVTEFLSYVLITEGDEYDEDGVLTSFESVLYCSESGNRSGRKSMVYDAYYSATDTTRVFYLTRNVCYVVISIELDNGDVYEYGLSTRPYGDTVLLQILGYETKDIEFSGIYPEL